MGRNSSSLRVPAAGGDSEDAARESGVLLGTGSPAAQAFGIPLTRPVHRLCEPVPAARIVLLQPRDYDAMGGMEGVPGPERPPPCAAPRPQDRAFPARSGAPRGRSGAVQVLPTTRSHDVKKIHWIYLIPPFVFALLAALHLVVDARLRRHDNDTVRFRTEATASHAANRIGEYFTTRIGILEHLRDDWLLHEIRTPSQFTAHVSLVQGAVGGFQAINWIDPEGVIRWVVPEDGNREAHDADLKTVPAVAPVIRRAAESGTTQVGPPVELLQGGCGFTVYVPIVREGQLEGYVNGVFRSSDAVTVCLDPDVRRSFHVAIHDGDAPLYRHGELAGAASQRLAAVRRVHVGPVRWRIELTPTDAFVQTMSRPVNHVLLAQGMVLAACLSGILAVAMVRERRLAASERRYRLLVEHVEDGIVISQDDRFIFFNPRFAKMLGYSYEELRLKNYKEIYTPRSLEILYERRRRRDSGEDVPPRYETVFYRKDGITIDVEASVAIIGYNGRLATFGVIRDITQRKRADAQLAKREQYLACLTEITVDLLAARLPEASMPAALARLREVADVDRVYIFANRRSESGDIISSRKFESCGPHGDSAEHSADMCELSWRQAGLEDWGEEMSRGDLISRQAAEFTPAERTVFGARGVQSILVLPMATYGEWYGFIGFDSCRVQRLWNDQDIQLLRTAAAAISGAIERSLADDEGRILAQLATRLAGATALDEVLRALREESDRLFQWDAYFLAAVEDPEHSQVLDQVDTVDGEKREILPHAWKIDRESHHTHRLLEGKGVLINRANGDDDHQLERFGDEARVSASIVQVPVRSGGSIVGIISVQSYTPSRYVERDLRALQRVADTVASALKRVFTEQVRIRLATAVEQVAESVIITDGQGVIEYVNPAFEKSSGYTRGEAVGRTPGFLKSGRHPRAMYEELWKTIRAGGVWTGRFVNRRKDGSLYREEATISPVRDGNGRITNFVGVKRDVSKEVALESQLRQAQKMEAIGTLAGGIAHDFNNLLTGILGYASFMRSAPDDPKQVGEAAAVIEKAAQRAADLTRQLLGFARGGKHQNVPVDLHRTIDEVMDLLKRTIDKNIRMEQCFEAPVARALGDPGQMQQVMLNLALNARDALPHGGCILFRTDVVDRDERVSANGETSPAGCYVRIRVEDNGCGIPQHELERIFEPFFTTKEHGRGTGGTGGTGMGLAMVYGIVHNHGGFIEVSSEVDRGSTFDVYLPIYAEGPPAEKPAPRRTIPRGSGRILLVDDEELVRNVAAQILGKLGYRVDTASDGLQAIESYRATNRGFDLVILDMIMPEMGGWDCFHGLKKIDPDVRAILSTGYGMDGMAQRILDEGMLGFVQKPYRASDLARVVASVLANGSHGDGATPTFAAAAAATPCTSPPR